MIPLVELVLLVEVLLVESDDGRTEKLDVDSDDGRVDRLDVDSDDGRTDSDEGVSAGTAPPPSLAPLPLAPESASLTRFPTRFPAPPVELDVELPDVLEPAAGTAV